MPGEVRHSDGVVPYEVVADVYDEWFAMEGETARTVAFLEDVTEGRTALELGVGTGRVALPLADKGWEVTGIDASPAMLDRLSAKPAGARLTVVFGDIAHFDLGRDFDLIYCVFNTYLALLSPEAQLACLRSCARHLRPAGRLVVEAVLPRPGPDQPAPRTSFLPDGSVLMQTTEHDLPRQRISFRHILFRDGLPPVIYPAEMRYVLLGELDADAERASLRVVERWAGWSREPLDPSSGRFVAVMERAATEPTSELEFSRIPE